MILKCAKFCRLCHSVLKEGESDKCKRCITNPLWSVIKTYGTELQAARDYANYSIKEGCTEQEDWENLTDEQLIQKAKVLGELGDLQADVIKGEL